MLMRKCGWKIILNKFHTRQKKKVIVAANKEKSIPTHYIKAQG
jgi:hypothetical protein